ncbi:hypothetical protein QBC47DRAFT_410526 [Echria macrotheca]|uniref:Uncharacterized protein n=1 Tax=Echria macrotheca TaxID=438768 RepID=A0AAJ0F940_9PEZI|nr:hypothetical protein QBC47DRAFT_410526 [Echria macrotheca]
MKKSLTTLPLVLLKTATATPQIGCTTPLNLKDTLLAAASLAKYCAAEGDNITRNTKDGGNFCGQAEIQTAWDAIQQTCGAGMGGWWFEPEWKKTYGFDVAEASWCGNL